MRCFILLVAAVLTAMTTREVTAALPLGAPLRFFTVDNILQPVFFNAGARLGLNITIETNGFKESTVVLDAQTDRFYDVYGHFFPAASDWIADLTDAVKDPMFKYDEVTSSSRINQATLNGRVRCIPIDADTYLQYYRRDLIASPARTWEELIEMAKLFHGRDLNGDGTPDFGICMNGDRWYHSLYLILQSIMKFESGSRQGVLFDINEDDSVPMTYLFNANEGYRYAFNLAKQILELTQGSYKLLTGTNIDFGNGRCAFYLSYPSAGTQTMRPGAYLKSRLGLARAPGTAKVFDRATKQLVTCEGTQRCPRKEAGNINRPQLFIGGNCLSIRRDSANAEAAKLFAAYISNNIDVRLVGGINPFRKQHFNVSYFVEGGWDRQDAELYINGIQEAADQDHIYSFPRWFAGLYYWTEVERAFFHWTRLPKSPMENETAISLDDALNTYGQAAIASALRAGYTLLSTEQNIRQVSNLPLYSPKAAAQAPVALIVSVTVIGGILIAVIVFVGVRKLLHNRTAPKNADAFTTCFICCKNSARLWTKYPDSMDQAIHQLQECAMKAAAATGCYFVKRVGEHFMITSRTPAAALRCAVEMKRLTRGTKWNKLLVHGHIAESSHGRIGNEASRRASTVDPSHRNTTTTTMPHTTRSTASKSTVAGGSHNDALEVSFGIHTGSGFVAHVAQHDAYDYSGACVTLAAVAADAAAAGQILTTAQAAAEVAELAEYFLPFSDIPAGKEAIPVYQYNDPSEPAVTYTVAAASDDRVNSVAASLELQAGGVTQRRVSIVAVRIIDFTARMGALDRESMQAAHVDTVNRLRAVTVAHRAELHSFLNGTAIITLNAATSTANHGNRAALIAMGVRSTLIDMGYENVAIGIHSGMSTVGHAGGNDERKIHVLVTNALRQAELLSAVAHNYPGSIIAPASMIADFGSACIWQYVDAVKVPGAPTNHVIGIVAIRGPLHGDDNDVHDDEWLYTLQKVDEANPFFLPNKIFAAFLEKGRAAAMELLLEVPSASLVPSSDDSNRVTSRDDGFAPIRAILSKEQEVGSYGMARGIEVWGMLL